MVNVVSFSVAGGHAVNEDVFAVERHPQDPECWVCVLADGQGGRAGGARAAQVACRTALAAALALPPRRLAAPSVWPELLGTADDAVRDDPEAGFTTLVAFSIAGEAFAGASSGDSAVLVATKGQRPSQLTAKQAKNPPVGSGDALFRPFRAKLTLPWSVLAMSDGVWHHAGWGAIEDAMMEVRGQQLVDQLRGGARPRGVGRFADDFTVVAFDRQA